MHAEVSLTYDCKDRILKLDVDRYERLVKGFPALDLPIERPEKLDFHYWNTYVIDLTTTGELLSTLGLPFEVKRFKSTYKVEGTDTGRHTHLHVAIPNIGLLMVDEVMLIEDACTDELQSRLNDRWRILAVCPPAMQRRPDYILGRTKKDEY